MILASLIDGYDCISCVQNSDTFVDLSHVLHHEVAAAFDNKLQDISLPLEYVMVHNDDMDDLANPYTRVFINPALLSPFPPNSSDQIARYYNHVSRAKVF